MISPSLQSSNCNIKSGAAFRTPKPGSLFSFTLGLIVLMSHIVFLSPLHLYHSEMPVQFPFFHTAHKTYFVCRIHQKSTSRLITVPVWCTHEQHNQKITVAVQCTQLSLGPHKKNHQSPAKFSAIKQVMLFFTVGLTGHIVCHHVADKQLLSMHNSPAWLKTIL